MQGGSPRRVGISYRRDDTAPVATRLYDRLRYHYGSSVSVYIDVSQAAVDTDFATFTRRMVAELDALLVLIGPRWVDREGSRAPRIVSPHDPVHIEIATALALRTPILPILVNGAAMPDPDQLPGDIKSLSYINALTLNESIDFQRLLHFLDNRMAFRDDAVHSEELGVGGSAHASSIRNVFISHATEDHALADDARRRLESEDIRCWIAPRDLVGGGSFASQIVEAISQCNVLLLALTEHSNRSADVANEVYQAHKARKHTVVYKVGDVTLSNDMEYYVGRLQWQPDLDRVVYAVTAALRRSV